MAASLLQTMVLHVILLLLLSIGILAKKAFNDKLLSFLIEPAN